MLGWSFDPTSMHAGAAEINEDQTCSYPDFADWRSQNHVFEQMAVYTNNSVTTLTDGGEATHVQGEAVSANLFSILRVQPILGRGFLPKEDEPFRELSMSRLGWGASPHIAEIILEELKERGLWVVGVDPAGTKNWTEYDYTGPVALVLGGEHRGLRRLVREHCDELVRLPMLGKIASLNISVAAAIVLYEVVRQRRRGGPDAKKFRAR